MQEQKGGIVTIDAMGCQTEIAQTIVEKQADYVPVAKLCQMQCDEEHMGALRPGDSISQIV